MTALLKYRTEELMQTSLSHRCQFLLFIALLRRKRCVYLFSWTASELQSCALTLGHMRWNDYSTTEIFVDNFLLSIMSTNCFSPSVDVQHLLQFCCFGRIIILEWRECAKWPVYWQITFIDHVGKFTLHLTHPNLAYYWNCWSAVIVVESLCKA